MPELRPDPLAFSYRPLARPRQVEDLGTDSATCTHGGCRLPSTWRYFLGDLAEHVARQNLCDAHAAEFDQYAGRIVCTTCHNKMHIEIREKMTMDTELEPEASPTGCPACGSDDYDVEPGENGEPNYETGEKVCQDCGEAWV